jgi:Ser/Thr protein kinase RdoA (MazF antagonist)
MSDNKNLTEGAEAEMNEQSPRPVMNPELLHHVEQDYGIRITNEPKDLGGSRNLNLLVVAGNSKYVLRVYRTWITSGRLAAIQTARQALGSNGIPAPVVKPTLAGGGWTTYDNSLVELEDYIDHDGNMDTWERLETGLSLLGRVHSIFKTLTTDGEDWQPVIANHIASNEVQKLTEQATEHIEKWRPTETQSKFIFLARDITSRLQQLETIYASKISSQLVHGDFWDNNVFFQNGKVVLVTDLDFMGVRPRIDDLALTLYYTNSTFSEDQLSESRIRRLKTLVDAYDSGLEEPLTADELVALPMAIARTPLFMMNYFISMTSEQAAKPMTETLPDLEWGVKLLDNLEKWQTIFTANR